MEDSEKSYLLTFTENEGYLYANLTAAAVNEDIIRGYVSEIVAKCDEVGTNKILLYRDIPVALSEGNVFHTVNESLELLRGKKIALVNPHKELDAEIGFGMTVGQNRGGDYKLFSDVKSAQAWLLK